MANYVIEVHGSILTDADENTLKFKFYGEALEYVEDSELEDAIIMRRR